MDYGVVTVEDGLAQTGSGITPKMVRGMDSLFQSVVMELASSSVAGSGGSGFFDALFKTPPGDPDTALIYDAFRRARANLFAYQAERTGLPKDEILKDLQLLDLRPVESSAMWEVDIRLVNTANEELTRTLPVGG